MLSVALLLKLALYVAAGVVGLFLAKLVLNQKPKKNFKQRQNAEENNGSSSEDEGFEKIEQTFQSHPEDDVPHIAYANENQLSPSQMLSKSEDFYHFMRKRRSVRFFSSRKVEKEVVENCIRTAGETWVRDLRALRTDWNKPYLEDAPFTIAVFRVNHLIDANGDRQPIHYGEISCSIAVGILLTAIQQAGLVTVTSTPLNCGPAIRAVLERPPNEKLVFLLPVGYPADDATVPDLQKKDLNQIMKYY